MGGYQCRPIFIFHLRNEKKPVISVVGACRTVSGDKDKTPYCPHDRGIRLVPDSFSLLKWRIVIHANSLHSTSRLVLSVSLRHETSRKKKPWTHGRTWTALFSVATIGHCTAKKARKERDIPRRA